MRKSFQILVIVFCLVGFIACDNDDRIVVPEKPDTNLNFGQLKEGHVTKFLRFESQCDNFQNSIVFTGDTLLWTVESVADTGIVLSEGFTKFSPMAEFFPKQMQAVRSENDYILMADRWQSNLFFFYGNDTLWVDPPASVELLQDGCQLKDSTNPFRGDAIGHMSKVNIDKLELADMTVVSCVPNWVIDAYIIYKEGRIYAIYSLEGFSGKPSGWIALD